MFCCILLQHLVYFFVHETTERRVSFESFNPAMVSNRQKREINVEIPEQVAAVNGRVS